MCKFRIDVSGWIHLQCSYHQRDRIDHEINESMVRGSLLEKKQQQSRNDHEYIIKSNLLSISICYYLFLLILRLLQKYFLYVSTLFGVRLPEESLSHRCPHVLRLH